MAVLLANVARTTLAASVAAVDTTLHVSTGHGSKFPTGSVGDWFPVVLEDATGTIEICRATGRLGDAITVERGQEGTMARAFAAGSACELRITAGALREFVTALIPVPEPVEVPTGDFLMRASNLFDLTNRQDARNNLEVYSWDEVDDRIAQAQTPGVDISVFMRKDANLFDLTNRQDARNNLEVYSKNEVNDLVSGATPAPGPSIPSSSTAVGAVRLFKLDNPYGGLGSWGDGIEFSGAAFGGGANSRYRQHGPIVTIISGTATEGYETFYLLTAQRIS